MGKNHLYTTSLPKGTSLLHSLPDQMDVEGTKFGKGPKELGGSVDLVNYYKLQPLHDFCCKRSVPSSISETKYLHNVVGDKKIRKGQGMELDQLFQKDVGDRQARLRPFDLEILTEAFRMREANPINLPYGPKGIATTRSKSKNGKKDEKRHKRRRDKDMENHKDHKKHKQQDTNTKRD